MKYCVHICFVCFGVMAATAIANAATITHLPTALVVLNRATGADQSSSVIEFSSVDFQSASAVRLLLPDGKIVTIARKQVALVFHYPDATATLNGTADVKALEGKRDEALWVESRYPKSKAALDPVIAGIDADLQKLAAGQVRYGVIWQTPGSTVPSRPNQEDLAILTLKGTTYHRLIITRLDNGAITMTHDGGVLRVPLIEAPPELLTALHAKPELFHGLKPLAELSVVPLILKQAILMGMHDDELIVLHQGGVAALAKSRMNAEQMQALASTNPTLRINGSSTAPAAPAPAVSTVQADTSVAGRLRFEPGTGKREVADGWECAGDETKQWQIASQESLDAAPDLSPQTAELSVREELQLYQKALEFVNTRLPLQLGYSRTNHCLVFRSREYGVPEIRLAFDPHKIDARIGSNDSNIQIEGLDGAETIVRYSPGQNAKGDYHLWRDLANRIVMRADDPTRVAKALSTILQLLGARAGSF